jgi:hypothetical protein
MEVRGQFHTEETALALQAGWGPHVSEYGGTDVSAPTGKLNLIVL